MKTQNQIRSLLLACFAVASLLVAPVTSRADANGTKPYKSTEVTVSRTDGFAPHTWQDAFLVQARLTQPGFYYEDSELISEGHDNYVGRFTKVSRQILIFTSPTTAAVYIWAEKTGANGQKSWSGVAGNVDFTTGIVNGNWLCFADNNPAGEVTGSGAFTSVARPDLGPRIYETTATGRVLTVGALKR
jgi:hypothetical protein